MIDSKKLPKQTRWLFLSLLTLSFFALYLPAILRLMAFWGRSEDYSHGFLIIPLSLYLIWRKKAELLQTEIRPDIRGLILILSSLAIYILAEFAEVTTLASASMIIVIIGCVLFLLGAPTLKCIFFPLCFLFFMIPIPGQIYSQLTIPLQLFVSTISSEIAQVIKVPLYREGNVIQLPEYTLQVVQACSGLRSMIALLTLSAIMGYLSLKTNFLRALLLAASVPTAIFVNIVRVLTMILAFYYFNTDLTEGAAHTVFGAAIFVLAMLLLVLLSGILNKWERSRQAVLFCS